MDKLEEAHFAAAEHMTTSNECCGDVLRDFGLAVLEEALPPMSKKEWTPEKTKYYHALRKRIEALG